MCGIVGYVGKEECTSILVNALRRLEYRGYDSAGIAVFEGDKLYTVKAKGKIDDGLIRKLQNNHRSQRYNRKLPQDKELPYLQGLRL